MESNHKSSDNKYQYDIVYIPYNKKSSKMDPTNNINKYINKYNTKNKNYYSHNKNNSKNFSYITNSDIYYENKS